MLQQGKTMNSSFELELTLSKKKSAMARERGRDPGGTVPVMTDIPELYYTHLCPTLLRPFSGAASCPEAPPRCRDDGTTRGLSVQQTALGSFDAPLVSQTVP